MKIAVLLTSFNRKEKTLACLKRLNHQILPDGTKLEVFLTDDDSVDGTPLEVAKAFPETHLYKGTGHLYWAGGMRHTWKKSVEYNPDFFLLLNDDTLLYENAVSILINTAFLYTNAICVGSTCDDLSGKLSYGGHKLSSQIYWRSKVVYSEIEITDCDFANANILLVPKQVVQKIGILSEQFTHSLADFDYCLGARKRGFKIKIAPGFLGTCINDHGKNWKSNNISLKKRIEYLKSPKGLAYEEYLFFIRKNFPLSYPSAFVKLWLKTFFPWLWDKYKS